MNPEQSPILRVEGLSREVQGKSILCDISLEVSAGEVLAIAGPSGSGKSSLLRLLNRLDEPTSGTVFVNGVDYRQMTPRQLRREVGMVTQQAFLFPGDVAQNLAFGPRQAGETLALDTIRDLLRSVGLSGYEGRNVATLSGGEAQRVSLARTLANTPLVILLDEPTSALDERSKNDIEVLLRDIVRSRHLTCIMVTHDLSQARRIADRILILGGGRMARIGVVQEVLGA